MKSRLWKLPFGLVIAWLCYYSASARAQTLKVPFAALSPNYAPLWIADRAGLFKKYGLDVQPVYILAGSVIVPAIPSSPVLISNRILAQTLTAQLHLADPYTIGANYNTS